MIFHYITDSPRRWFLFHWFSLGVTTLGIVTLLLSRGHYSIDVVIAYWITTRLWWMYHTLANHEVLKSADNSENYLNKIWWWYIFNYFEGNEIRQYASIIMIFFREIIFIFGFWHNFYFLGRVPPRLPREYGWPIPEKLLQWNFFRRRNLETSEEDLEAGLSRQPSQHRDWNSFSRKNFVKLISWKKYYCDFRCRRRQYFQFFFLVHFFICFTYNIFFSLLFPLKIHF